MRIGRYSVETFSGQFVDTKTPDPKTIRLEDIAHALSQICRYGGHCAYHYSVAEHAVFVSKRLERQGYGREQCSNGLHHDDAEAYLGDIPRPLKPLLGRRYKTLTGRMDDAISEALSVPIGIQSASWKLRTKEADNWALFVEAKFLMPSQGKGWLSGNQGASDWDLSALPSRIVAPDYWFSGGLSPSQAKDLYLARHKELSK